MSESCVMACVTMALDSSLDNIVESAQKVTKNRPFPKKQAVFMAADEGFEPSQTESESKF